MERLFFSKFHGLGNDFLIVDRRAGGSELDADRVTRICDRHRGVGADGILSVHADPDADVRMRVQNADGSEPETCGNGLRCVAWWAAHRIPELQGRERVRIATGAGVVEARLFGTDPAGGEVRVSMGRPGLELGLLAPLAGGEPVLDRPFEVAGRRLALSAISMGNPHAVIFEGASEEEAGRLGPLIERHPAFPAGVNVGFARLEGGEGLALTVWERGCGLTQACGTGACAAAVAAVATGRLPADRELPVRLPGGTLRIEVAGDLSDCWMTGPARWVYDGQTDPALFDGGES